MSTVLAEPVQTTPITIPVNSGPIKLSTSNQHVEPGEFVRFNLNPGTPADSPTWRIAFVIQVNSDHLDILVFSRTEFGVHLEHRYGCRYVDDPCWRDPMRKAAILASDVAGVWDFHPHRLAMDKINREMDGCLQAILSLREDVAALRRHLDSKQARSPAAHL